MRLRWLAASVCFVALVSLSTLLVLNFGRRSGGDHTTTSRAPASGDGDAPGGCATTPQLEGRAVPALSLEGTRWGGIRGLVLDAKDGNPMPGIPVLVYGVESESLEFDDPLTTGLVASVTSGEGGEYRALVEGGTVALVLALGNGWLNAEAARPGMTSSDLVPWRCKSRRGQWVDHDIRVLPGARIEGLVLRADGTPAAGAHVTPFPKETDPPTRPSSFPWSVFHGALCDDAGAFVIDALPPATALLIGARDAECGTTHVGPMDVAPGSTNSVVVRYSKCGSVLVNVVEADTGSPVPDAVIIAAWPRAESAAPLIGAGPMVTTQGLANAEGVVRLSGVPRHPILVSVAAPGHVPLRVGLGEWEDLLEQATDESPIRMELSRGVTTMGHLDVPAYLQPNWLQVVCLELGVPEGRDRFRAVVPVDANGEFRVLTPPQGRFALSVHRLTQRWAILGRIEVDAGATGFVLKPEVTTGPRPPEDASPEWTVRAHGPQGERVAWLDVRAVGRGGAFLAARGSLQETCEIRLTAQGPVWLLLSHGTTHSGARLGGTSLGPFEPGEGEVDVHLPGPWSASGRAVGASGRPMQGVHVLAILDAPPEYMGDERDWQRAAIHAEAYTDARGCFQLEGLGGDSYHLVVKQISGTELLPGALVRAGDDPVTIQLDG